MIATSVGCENSYVKRYWCPQSGFSELLAGGVLRLGQSMTSPDGHTRFVFQDDGNVVVRTCHSQHLLGKQRMVKPFATAAALGIVHKT